MVVNYCCRSTRSAGRTATALNDLSRNRWHCELYPFSSINSKILCRLLLQAVRRVLYKKNIDVPWYYYSNAWYRDRFCINFGIWRRIIIDIGYQIVFPVITFGEVGNDTIKWRSRRFKTKRTQYICLCQRLTYATRNGNRENIICTFLGPLVPRRDTFFRNYSKCVLIN